MNAKKNPQIGKMADDILIAIEQEKMINQNIHDIHGRVTSNIGMVIERIINDEPEIWMMSLHWRMQFDSLEDIKVYWAE